MSVATKPTQTPQPRIWRVPTTRARWLWLAFALVLNGLIFAWYYYAMKTQQFPAPINDPFRLFGILATVLVLSTAAYSLRRRFARGLPGKVQDWLWMHIWIGISTILIAMLHENFAYLTHDYCQNLSCLSDTYYAPLALFSLIFLVISGITGRLLDVWQTRVIAREASSNGVGIARALDERILELEYTVERLCAGKSEPFKQYCMQAIENSGALSSQVPSLSHTEHADFKRAYETLTQRASLLQSLQRQKRARLIIDVWRRVHIVLASLALLVILYHSVMELLTNVFNVIHSS